MKYTRIASKKDKPNIVLDLATQKEIIEELEDEFCVKIKNFNHIRNHLKYEIVIKTPINLIGTDYNDCFNNDDIEIDSYIELSETDTLHLLVEDVDNGEDCSDKSGVFIINKGTQNEQYAILDAGFYAIIKYGKIINPGNTPTETETGQTLNQCMQEVNKYNLNFNDSILYLHN